MNKKKPEKCRAVKSIIVALFFFSILCADILFVNLLTLFTLSFLLAFTITTYHEFVIHEQKVQLFLNAKTEHTSFSISLLDETRLS